MSEFKLELYKLAKSRAEESEKEIESIKFRMVGIKLGYQLNVINKTLRNLESTYELNSYIYKTLKYDLDKLNLL